MGHTTHNTEHRVTGYSINIIINKINMNLFFVSSVLLALSSPWVNSLPCSEVMSQSEVDAEEFTGKYLFIKADDSGSDAPLNHQTHEKNYIL